MIISASRRTDIPAYFGRWFIKRIEEGYFYRANPFNPNQVRGFSLLREDVDAIIFWTKNPEPFLPYLDFLDARGYAYYFLYTLNDYPALFEPGLPDIEHRVDTFRNLSRRISRQRVIWRYDPIIISSLTPVDYHLERIEKLSERLNGYTMRVIISFLDFYGKVKKRLIRIEGQQGITFRDIRGDLFREELFDFAREFVRIVKSHGMQVQSCAEAVDLDQCGIIHGSCVDEDLIHNLFSVKKKFGRDNHQRRNCMCARSVDLGMYDTCRAGCIYCYANLNEKKVKSNLRIHSSTSPLLIGKLDGSIEIISEDFSRTEADSQCKLF